MNVKKIPKKIMKLIEKSETVETEFKKAMTSNIMKAMIAFANKKGGVILVGVDEVKREKGIHVGKIKGIDTPNIQEDREIVGGWAREIIPTVQYNFNYFENEGNDTIYVIHIKESNEKPVGSKSGLYKIRSDTGNNGIDPITMRSLIVNEESYKKSLLFEFQENLKLCEQLNRQLSEKPPAITYRSYRTLTINTILANTLYKKIFDFEYLAEILYRYEITNKLLSLAMIEEMIYPTDSKQALHFMKLKGNVQKLKKMIEEEISKIS